MNTAQILLCSSREILYQFGSNYSGSTDTRGRTLADYVMYVSTFRCGDYADEVADNCQTLFDSEVAGKYDFH